jgi:hypothetical protein
MKALRAEIVRLASRYGRYGYRRITALLRNDRWDANHKRVERIWRQEGLKVPKRHSKRGRLWLGSIGVKTPFIEPGGLGRTGIMRASMAR